MTSRLIILSSLFLILPLAACESDSPPDPEWVEPGTQARTMGTITYTGSSGGSDGCAQEADCIPAPIDMCWMKAYATTLAIVEIEGEGRVVQSTEDCAAPYRWPGRLMPIRVLGVVGGETLPYRMEAFLNNGTAMRRAHPGATLLVGLRQSGDWFILERQPVDVYQGVIGSSNNERIDLPSTFDGLVQEWERVSVGPEGRCEGAHAMTDEEFDQHVHTPTLCEVAPDNEGEVWQPDPTGGVGYPSDDE